MTISMQPVTIARLLKRQPRLFEGHVEPLLHRYLKPAFFERTDFEERAGIMLRRKFDFAARGILLRAVLDTSMYELPPEECFYHFSYEDRWNPEENAVVRYTVFDSENMDRIRIDMYRPRISCAMERNNISAFWPGIARTQRKQVASGQFPMKSPRQKS